MSCARKIVYNLRKHVITNTCKFLSIATGIGVLACYGLCYVNRLRVPKKDFMQTKSELNPSLVRAGFNGMHK